MARAAGATASLGHRRDAPNNFRGSVGMDTNLITAGIYLVISCLYVQPHHGLWSRLTLATAAMLLALLAACKSDNVRGLNFRQLERPQWEIAIPMFAENGNRNLISSV